MYFLGHDDSGNFYREKQLHDVWSDIVSVGHAGGRQRTGYATQKPRDLLTRIIGISSGPDDVILDPFCGCGTTLEAAQLLGRRWIGIDIAIHAVKRVSAVRLRDDLGLAEGKHFEIRGVPHTLEGAQDLWHRDKYHFQQWA